MKPDIDKVIKKVIKDMNANHNENNYSFQNLHTCVHCLILLSDLFITSKNKMHDQSGQRAND